MHQDEWERLRIKAEVFKAMGHPIRPGILEMLSPGEKCVCEIFEYDGRVKVAGKVPTEADILKWCRDRS
jgi:hypothetical protein